MGLTRTAAARYLTTVAAVDAAAAGLGYWAGTGLPHPLAVLTVICCLTAITAAPFITPIDPTEEPPREPN